MDLHLIERQRNRIYKQQLKDQFQKQKLIKEFYQLQNKNKEKQKLQRQRASIIQEDKLSRQKSKQLYQRLTNQNKYISQTRQYDNPHKDQLSKHDSSLLDQLYSSDNSRIKSWKQNSQQMRNKNHQEQNIHKENNLRYKNLQRNQQQLHLNRLKEVQQLRRKQYEGIKNRHIQDMNTYERHKKLIQLNQQYKNSLEEFAYKDKDILDHLRRNDKMKIKQKSKNNAKQLKEQMNQKRSKSSFQKCQKFQKTDLQKSIFKDILFKDNKFNKKEYEKQLLDQIRQRQKNQLAQKSKLKKKVQIGSIYGGLEGDQRLKMLQQVDSSLGIHADYLKLMSESKTNYRINNLHMYKDQKDNKVNQIERQLFNPEQEKAQKHQKKITLETNLDLSKSYTFTDNKGNSYINQKNDQINKKYYDNKTKKFVTYDTITGKQKMYQL